MNKFLSLKEHVYNFIAEDINKGNLKPDDKINEQSISEALNVSRTPVREALIQLASDGLLVNIPRKGFVIKGMDSKDAIDNYEIIGALDGLAASLAFDSLNDNDYKNMKFYIDSMYLALENDNFSMYLLQQEAFHDIYTNMCGNTALIELLARLKKKFVRRSYDLVNAKTMIGTLKSTNAEHEEILRLFVEGDRKKVEEYIRDVHWATVNAHYDAIEKK